MQRAHQALAELAETGQSVTVAELATRAGVHGHGFTPSPSCSTRFNNSSVRAVEHGCWIIEVELICSDQDEHRRRVEGSSSDMPGLVLPTWQQVRERHYAPWDRDHLVIDTGSTSVDDAVQRIHEHASNTRHPR